MNCSFHSDREATAFCRTCGRALCAEDQREIYGVVYCQACLARQMGQLPAGAAVGATPGPASSAGAPQPAVALLLGFIPGVGAVYNGQYLKAFLQVVVFAFLISLKDWSWGLHGLAQLGSVVFYFYMVVDSYRTAKTMQRGEPVSELWGANANLPVDLPIAAVILIVIGCLYLMRSLGWFEYDVSRYFWPVVLIAVGVWMTQRGRRGGNRRGSAADNAPGRERREP